MKRPLLIIVVLVIALIILRRYSQSTEFFEDGAATKVIIAKAEWCGHCKAAAPEFKKLVDASPLTLKDGTRATVEMLDADADKQAIQQLPQKVRGYPTIMILKGSQAKEYPGERTMQGVLDFLNVM